MSETIKQELLDIFENISPMIPEIFYMNGLKLINMIGKRSVEKRERTEPPRSNEELGNRLIGIDLLVTRGVELVCPTLTESDVEFLTHKFLTNGEWRYQILNENEYIYNVFTRRFVPRGSPNGKSIQKRCLLTQFSHLFVIDRINGKVMRKDTGVYV